MSDLDPLHPPRVFHASPKSSLGRLRLWLWLAVLVPLALSGPRMGFSSTWWMSTATTLGVAAIIHWMLTRQLRLGEPVVVLDDDGITSSRFRPLHERYRWDEIAEAIGSTAQGVPMLQLVLQPSPTRPDQRRFWSGLNPARPTLMLNMLTPEDQLLLVDRVRQRLAAQAGTLAQASGALHEAHRFEADLKARTPVAWVCHALAALNIAAWGITLSLGADPFNPTAPQLLAWGGNAASEVQHGAWWRLFTATFLHSGLTHLAMNMVGLWAIGTTVERLFGHRLFLLVYLASALAGSALSLHFSAQQAVSVGASGAVFGLAGALLTVVIRHRRSMPPLFGARNRNSMLFFIAYSLFQGFTKPGVDNAAHVGGLLAGAALAWVLPERLSAVGARRPVGPALLWGSVAAALVCTLVAWSAPSAQRDVRALFEGEQHFVSGLRGIEGAINALRADQQALLARRMSPSQLETRTRQTHVPALRAAQAELAQATLPADDPRQPVLVAARRLLALTLRRLDPPSPLGPLERQALDEELQAAAQAFGAANQALAQRAASSPH